MKPVDNNTDGGSTSLIINKLIAISAQITPTVSVEHDNNSPQLSLKPQATPQATPSLADVLNMCMQSKEQLDQSPT